MVQAYQHSCYVMHVAPIPAYEGQWLSRCFHPTLGTVSSIGRALTSVRRLRVRFPYCPVEIQGSSSSHCPVLPIASCVMLFGAHAGLTGYLVYLWLSCPPNCFGVSCYHPVILMLPSELHFVIDIVLLATGLQAQFVWCFCTPPYLQLQSLTRDIFS